VVKEVAKDVVKGPQGEKPQEKEGAAAQEKESARKPEEAPKGTPGEQGSRKTSAAARRDRRNKSKEQEHGAYSKSAQKTGFMIGRPAEVLMNDTDEDIEHVDALGSPLPANELPSLPPHELLCSCCSPALCELPVACSRAMFILSCFFMFPGIVSARSWQSSSVSFISTSAGLPIKKPVFCALFE
jgi:hypothetical protein